MPQIGFYLKQKMVNFVIVVLLRLLAVFQNLLCVFVKLCLMTFCACCKYLCFQLLLGNLLISTVLYMLIDFEKNYYGNLIRIHLFLFVAIIQAVWACLSISQSRVGCFDYSCPLFGCRIFPIVRQCYEEIDRLKSWLLFCLLG